MSDQSEILQALSANAEALKRVTDRTANVADRLLELEQKSVRAPSSFGGGETMHLSKMLLQSEGLKSFMAGNTQSCSIAVPQNLLTKTQIVNGTGSGQALVPADRRLGIVHGPQQRMTVRGLFNQMPTASNAIEYCVESTFTNNAGAQGSTSPVGNGEGELKNESAMTFTLANAPVRTLAHWIPASRQVLGDAPLLEAHLSNRLLFGLALIEETQMITGTGGGNTLTGLVDQATSFNGGMTNQTALDNHQQTARAR